LQYSIFSLTLTNTYTEVLQWIKKYKDGPQIISSENCQGKILMIIFMTILNCSSKYLFLNTDTIEQSSKSVKVMYENIMQERIAYFRKEQEQLKKNIYRGVSQDQTNKEWHDVFHVLISM